MSRYSLLFAVCAARLFASAVNTSTGVENPPNYDAMIPPAAGSSYTDPVFGTTIYRVTDALNTPNAESTGNLTWIENEYSTVAAYNRDNSYFILLHQSYFGLYNANGTFVRSLPAELNASSEPRWSRGNQWGIIDKTTLYYHFNNMLKSYNVLTGKTTVVHTFSEYSSISGAGEMDISLDGDHFVLVGDSRYIFVYQLSIGKKHKVFDTGGTAFDSVMITPKNNVIVSWDVSGNVRYTGQELFDVNMNFVRQVGHADGHKHTTVDTNGAEVLVWTNSNDPQPIDCQNGIVKIQLSNASQTCLQPLDWSLAVHITAPDGNGMAYVDTYAPSDPAPGTSGWVPYTNELLAIGLSGATVPYRIAHHRSQPRDSYLYQPKMTVSRDGTRLLYASNFDLQTVQGNPTDYADTYAITVNGFTPAPQTSVLATVSSDAGVVRYEQSDPKVTLNGSWVTSTNAADSGGSTVVATNAGATASFAFQGMTVTWIGATSPTSGIADVYVDGKLLSIIDTYSATPAPQAAQFSIHNLTGGAHTLLIVVTGAKNDSSRGTGVSVDAFDVTQ